MEIKATLQKPYTDKQRMNFIVSFNHRLGYEIREIDTALEAWGKTDEEKQAEEQAAEQERIANLTLTPADVERAIYKAKGMDFEDLVTLIKEQLPEVDLKAVKIELNANLFYRKHPLINQVGALLGYTPEDMTYMFENKELPEVIEESSESEVEPVEENEEVKE